MKRTHRISGIARGAPFVPAGLSPNRPASPARNLFPVLALSLALPLAAVAPAAPAAAQQMSEGFELLKAVKAADGDKVTALLAKPGTTVVNARDLTNGQTALHLVTQRRDFTWLRYLLSKGANPNLVDRAGTSPLQLAANLGWADGVGVLVRGGAAIDVTDSAGETPLIAAIHRRDAGLVRILLAAGANPDRTDNSGRSARDYAALMGPQSGLLAELDRSRAERRARAARTYGPGA